MRDTPSEFRFGPFCLDVREQALSVDGRPIPLRATTFRTLVALLRHSGHLVEKEQLLKEIWPDTFVEEGSLAHHVSLIRKALGQASSEEEYIETVPKRGYRFIAHVVEGPAASPAAQDVATAAGRDPIEAGAHDEALEATAPTVGPVQPADGDEAPHVTPVTPPLPPRARVMARRVSLVAACMLLMGVGATLSSVVARRPPRPPRTDARAATTVAVLPFATDGLRADEEYLGIALADVMISRFTEANAVVLRPGREVVREERDALTAGRALQVDHVLDGRIQRSGDTYRVTAHLIDARTGVTDWSATIDGASNEILRLEDQLAVRAANATVSAHRSSAALPPHP